MTGRTLITDALHELGVLAAGDELSAEDAELSLRRLNAFASSLNPEAGDWSLPAFDLDTDLSMADGVERALVFNLAVEIATSFGRTVTADLRRNAERAKALVKRSTEQTTDLITVTPFESRGSHPNEWQLD